MIKKLYNKFNEYIIAIISIQSSTNDIKEKLEILSLDIKENKNKLESITNTILRLDGALNYSHFVNYCFQSSNFLKFISSNFGKSREEKKGLISVIIPTHTNPECLWTRTIPSIMQQEGVELEIILVLDNFERDGKLRQSVEKILSTLDFTYPIYLIDEYASSNEKVIGFNTNQSQEKLARWLSGGVRSMRTGIRHAKGEWIIPFNHDDEIPTASTIKNLLNEVITFNSDIIMGQIQQKSPNGDFDRVFTNTNFSRDDYGTQGSIIKGAIAEILYDENDILYGFSGDWGFVNRLKLFRIETTISKINMCNYYPSNLWDNSNKEI